MFFERIVGNANDSVFVAERPKTTGRFRIAYANEAFSKLYGYSVKEAFGRAPSLLQGAETDVDVLDEIGAAIDRGETIRRRILNYDKTGRRIWVEVNVVPLERTAGRTTHFAAIARDAAADAQREAKPEDMALTDALTNVGNRRYFDQVLQRELSRALRTNSPLALAILDLDHFGKLNEDWGRQAGDSVLVGFVDEVLRAVRNYDYIARVGGEEFAIILPVAARLDALTVVERICANVRATAFRIGDDQAIRITCSAGLVAVDTSSDNCETMMSRADRALALAKSAGRDRVVELRS
jgi:diguanylate cyclase (GGDEF)-like protein/PAS domain S-box-containing protein